MRVVGGDHFADWVGQIPVASFLERLEKVNFDAFHPGLRVRDWRLAWRVWRSYYTCTF